MRPDVTSAELTLLQSGEYDEHWRLKIANGSGTMVDVSGRLRSGSVHFPSPDAPIGTAELVLARDVNDDTTTSLAPLVDASSYNRLDDTVTISPLIHVGRAVTLEVAVTARGAARPADGSALWHEVIGGFAKQPTWPQRYGDITVEVMDRAYKLMRTHIEAPNTYDVLTPTEDVIQAILDDVMGASTYPLTVDDAGSPPSGTTGSALSVNYQPDVVPVWEAIQALAASIGWVLWYRYDATGAAVLTLTEPRRAKATADYTFTNAQLADVDNLTVIEDDIRNVVVVTYLDEDGAEQSVTSSDATSITKYGGIRRYIQIVEDETSPIRTEAAAQGLRDAVLSDLKDPDADLAVRTFGAWFAGEPSVDLYAFPANDWMYDNAQTLAPYSIRIEFAQGSLASATIAARGKPSGGSGRWIGRRRGDPTVTGLAYVTLDLDGDDLYAVWAANSPIEQIRWLVDETDAPTEAEVRTTGAVNTTGEVLVHTFDPDGDPEQTIYFGYFAETADGTEVGSLSVQPFVYRVDGILPTIALTYLGRATDGNEKWLATATGKGTDATLYLRVYDLGDEPPAYDVIGPSADPVQHFFDFRHPEDGDPNVVIEAYAEDDSDPPVASEVIRRESDSDTHPTASVVLDVDPKDNETYFTVNAIDTDARSWRLRFAKGTEALPQFAGAGADEVAGTAIGVRTKVSAVTDLTALGDDEVMYVAGYAFNTSSTVAATQEAAPRSEVIRDSTGPGAVRNAIKSAWLEFEVVGGVRQVRAFWNLASTDGTGSLMVSVTENGGAPVVTKVNAPGKDGNVTAFTPASLLAVYVLTLGCYSEADYGGTAGDPVVYTLAAQPPQILSAWLELETFVNPPPVGTYREFVAHWNLATEDVGSLKLVITAVPAGPLDPLVVKVNAPAKDGKALTGYEPDPSGTFSVTVTPYSAADYGGVAGRPLTYVWTISPAVVATDQDGGQIVGPLALDPGGSLQANIDEDGNIAFGMRLTVGTGEVGELAPGELYGRYVAE